MTESRHPIIEEDLRQITSADLPWSEFAGATVLITGANGFIAAYCAETLLHLNERQLAADPVKVIALVRSGERAAKRFAAYIGRADLEIIVQDVSEPLPPRGRIDYIIHAASQASPKYYSPDPAGTMKPNVIGMYHLLEYARAAGTRGFLFLSSGEVYGKYDVVPTQPVGEDFYGTLDPLELRACYAEGKRAGETMCKAWFHQFGVPTRIARLGHTYGPGLDLDDGRVFADFVANIVRGENIVMKSDGAALRLFCYLADAVAGLFTVLLKGSDAVAYNVMNDEGGIRIIDLAILLCDLFPEKGLQVVLHRPPDPKAIPPVWNNGFPVSMERLRSLGWRPHVSVESGFRRTVLYYDDLENARKHS